MHCHRQVIAEKLGFAGGALPSRPLPDGAVVERRWLRSFAGPLCVASAPTLNRHSDGARAAAVGPVAPVLFQVRGNLFEHVRDRMALLGDDLVGHRWMVSYQLRQVVRRRIALRGHLIL
jgi:hypothetical protein